MAYEQTPVRAALARDRALARLRRLSGAALGAALLLSGAFAGIAANTTHPRKVVRRQTARPMPRNQAEPPLPSARPPSESVLAPPPSPPAPAPEASPPVVVSGGS